MRRFLALPFITASISFLGIWFPVELYSSTKSVFLLGLATTVYNATNGLGSYLWGDIIDRTHRRTEFVIAIPTMLSLSVLLLEGNLQEGLIGYGLVGFSSSLSSPLYSVILLENYDFEEVPRINSRLSQLNLAGNATGSLAAGLLGDVKFPLICSTAGLLISLVAVKDLKGKENIDVKERIRAIGELRLALLSFAAFNFGAEIFFTAFVPLNYRFGNSRFLIYAGYTILYGADELVYYLSSTRVKRRHEMTIFTVTYLRALILLLTSVALEAGLNLGAFTLPLFVSFGSLYPAYSLSFFSLIFRGLKKNRASIIGLFNSVEDVANILGSAAVSFMGNELASDYLMAFYSISLSILTLHRFLTAVSKRSLSPPQ